MATIRQLLEAYVAAEQVRHTELMAELARIRVGLLGTETVTGILPSLLALSDESADLLLGSNSLQARLVQAIAPTNEALPLDAKSSVAWSLYRLMDATAPDWPRPVSQPVQPGINTLIQLFQQVQGVDADAPRTALYYLSRLTAIALLEAVGAEPPEDVPDSTPIIQLGASTSNGRNYARWPNLAQYGIQYTQSIAGVPLNCELTPEGSDTWTGWRLYVQTNAPYAYLNMGDMVITIEPNQLITLSPERYALAVSVGEEYHINAILYAPSQNTSILSAAFTSANWVRYGASIGTFALPAWPQGVGQSNEPYRDQTQFFSSVRAWLPIDGPYWEYRIRTQVPQAGLKITLYNSAGFTNVIDAEQDGAWHVLDDSLDAWTHALFHNDNAGYSGYVDVRQTGIPPSP